VARSVAGIRARQARGLRFGRSPTSIILAAICETCGKDFLWTTGGAREGAKSQTTGRFCSHPCLVKWLHKHRQILPDIEVIKKMYWEDGMSLWEIARKCGAKTHKAVEHAMKKAGIRRRPRRNTGKHVCVVEGCKNPTFKIVHSNNKSPYGRRCEKHWVEHRKALQLDYQRRKHNSPMCEIAQAMVEGCSTSHEIAAVLNEPVRRISCTMGHMKGIGMVRIAGRARSECPSGQSEAKIYELAKEWKSKIPMYLRTS